jgi:hypothetical protein
MRDWLRYRYQLSRLHKERRDLSRSHKEAYDQAAKQQKPKHELYQLALECAEDIQINYDRVGILQTGYLTSLAEKRLIPMPEGSLPLDQRGNDKWRNAKNSAILYLNNDGIRELRVALRADRRERLDLVRSWLTSLTGLIGVIIGLLAIILKGK